MHELILFACAINRGVGAGVYAAKDTDRINVGTFILEVLGAFDGAIGNLFLEPTRTRR